VLDTWVTYCGSTERASASEREDRGYNIVDFETDGTVAISRRGLASTREFVFIDVELEEREGIDRVQDRVRQHDLADAVVIVTVEGEGRPITPAAIEELAIDRGALVARVNDRRDLPDEDDDVSVSFANPDEAVRERVRELGLSNAALEIDESVRNGDLADSNVRESVERRVRELLEDDESAFDPAPEREPGDEDVTTVADQLADESDSAADSVNTEATETADAAETAEADGGAETADADGDARQQPPIPKAMRLHRLPTPTRRRHRPTAMRRTISTRRKTATSPRRLPTPTSPRWVISREGRPCPPAELQVLRRRRPLARARRHRRPRRQRQREVDAARGGLLRALRLESADERTLDDVITTGQEECEIELWFTHDGREYQIERHLKLRGDRATTTKCVLETPTETIEGARDVRREVTELLRMDAEAFVNCAYVRQGEVNKLIHASPSDRQDMIDDLLQLGALEDYRERASDARLGVKTVLDGQQEVLEDVRKQVDQKEDKELHERLNGLESRRTDITDEIDRYESQREQAQETLETAADVLDRHEETREEIETLDEEVEELRSKITETERKREDASDEISEIRSRREALADERADLLEDVDLETDDPAEGAIERRIAELEGRDEELRTTAARTFA